MSRAKTKKPAPLQPSFALPERRHPIRRPLLRLPRKP